MEYLIGILIVGALERISPGLFDVTLGICVVGC